MKQIKRINRRYISLRTKLLGYFIVFGAIILIVLWVFQIFFIKPLYTMSKSHNVEQCMSKVLKAVETNKNVWLTMDNVASHYSLSIYIFKSGGGAPRDVVMCSYDNPATLLNVELDVALLVELLRQSNVKYKQTLIVITHDESIALQADRIIAIEDGRIVRDERIRGGAK